LGKRASLAKPQADDGHANNRTALTATQPRPPVSPTSSSNRFTPCACRQPECPELPAGQFCVQAPRSPSGRHPQNCYICAGTPLYSHRSAVIRRASRASHPAPRSPVSDNGTSWGAGQRPTLRLRAASPGEASAQMQYSI
jgi:hypothetical protein